MNYPGTHNLPPLQSAKLSRLEYYFRYRQLEEALQLLKLLGEVHNPLLQKLVMHWKARIQLIKGRYDAHAAHFTKAIQQLEEIQLANYPEEGQWVYDLCKAYAGTGEYKKALRILEQSLAENRFSAPVKLQLESLGIIFLVENGDFETCKAWMERSCKRSGFSSSNEFLTHICDSSFLIDYKKNQTHYTGSLAGNYEESDLNDEGSAIQYAEHSFPELRAWMIWLEAVSTYLFAKKSYRTIIPFSEALIQLAEALNYPEQRAIGLHYSAIHYADREDHKKAIGLLQEALDISKSIGCRPLAAQILINIGTIYALLYSRERALRRYQLVLQEYRDTLNDNTLLGLLNNVGNILYEQKEYKESAKYFEEARLLAIQLKSGNWQANALAQLSRCALAQGHVDESLSLADQAQSIFASIKVNYGRSLHLLNLAEIHTLKENYPLAISTCKDGIDLANSSNETLNELRGYKLLANIYRQMGEFQKALDFQIDYNKRLEAFNESRMKGQLTDLEIQHSLREKELLITQLKQSNEYKDLLLKSKEEIEKANVQLTHANEDLKQFAYAASHDLKEPLRMIQSYTQLIRKRLEPNFDESTREYYGYVSEGVNRMKSLLEDLLKYATIGKQHLEYQTVPLNNVIDLVKVNLTVQIEEAGALVNRQELPRIKSVRSLLVQLFQNLISNGIKFQKPGVIPEVNISYAENQSHHILQVIDNGIGIEKSHIERIFVIFQRLHTRTEYKGTGIGLAICQKIVNQLGGEIEVESEPGEGTCFKIYLPKNPD